MTGRVLLVLQWMRYIIYIIMQVFVILITFLVSFLNPNTAYCHTCVYSVNTEIHTCVYSVNTEIHTCAHTAIHVYSVNTEIHTCVYSVNTEIHTCVYSVNTEIQTCAYSVNTEIHTCACQYVTGCLSLGIGHNCECVSPWGDPARLAGHWKRKEKS